jgi:hypothetical protein
MDPGSESCRGFFRAGSAPLSIVRVEGGQAKGNNELTGSF